MAINKKFIVFKTKENFKKELEAGNILPSSWVVIKDTQEIYVKETFIKGFDVSKIAEIIDSKLEDYLTESEIKELLYEKEWFGTQSEFDTLNSYNENTKYYILED